MDRIKFSYYPPFPANLSEDKDAAPYRTLTVKLSKPWVREAIMNKLHEQRAAVYGIEPTGIVLDPKTAVQLSWECVGNYSGLGEIFGVPIHLAEGTNRIELLFGEKALTWLLAKKD